MKDNNEQKILETISKNNDPLFPSFEEMVDIVFPIIEYNTSLNLQILSEVD